MRVVDDAGDSRVNTSQSRDQIAHVHVLRAIVEGEPLMRGRHVFADVAVRDDASKYAFPRVAVTVDESGNEDRIRCIDHFARSLETGANGGDFLALDQ